MKSTIDHIADTMSDREIAKRHPDLPGWGIDANPENDPTYPMKKYTGADHQRLNYPKHPPQAQDVELLKSNERPTFPAVFGTSVPPSGLSGVLRRYAFKFSEGHAAHWMTLLLADRINVVEGVLDDFRHGIVPNIFKERGWNAEWKYNRKGMIKNMAVSAGIAAAVITLFVLNRSSAKKIKHV